MINYRITSILIVLFFTSFALGAVWLQKKAFPYDYIRQSDWLVMFKRNVVGLDKPQAIVESAFSDLEIDNFDVGSKVSVRIEKGGIHAIGNDVLVVSSRGNLFLYRNNLGEKSIKQLDIETNNNFDQVRSFAVENGSNDANLHRFFNFFDVLYLDGPTGNSIVLSHLYWHPISECFTLRLSQLRLAPEETLQDVSKSHDDWNVLYDTKPCLKLEDNHHLESTGGRIVLIDESTLLLTVGSLHRPPDNSDTALSQDPDADYGKVLSINLQNSRAKQLSVGHRNQQGLAIDNAGNIWITEHGPQGGDELNLIQPGSNYGYPHVVYGTDYGEKTWPQSKKQGFHEGYARPIFAWLPSVGTSNLIEVRGFLPEWEGDLLVTTLKQQTIYRMRYREGRIVFSEPIKVGTRIRDIDQLENGKIVLWTDTLVISEITPIASTQPNMENALTNLEESTKPEASRIIKSCQTCHSVTPYGSDSVAPNLWGVYGRKIASSGFTSYSASLKNKQGSWDEKNLDAFLQNTDSFAAGTTMAIPGIQSPEIRESVINYLKSLE